MCDYQVTFAATIHLGRWVNFWSWIQQHSCRFNMSPLSSIMKWSPFILEKNKWVFVHNVFKQVLLISPNNFSSVWIKQIPLLKIEDLLGLHFFLWLIIWLTKDPTWTLAPASISSFTQSTSPFLAAVCSEVYSVWSCKTGSVISDPPQP